MVVLHAFFLKLTDLCSASFYCWEEKKIWYSLSSTFKSPNLSHPIGWNEVLYTLANIPQLSHHPGFKVCSRGWQKAAFGTVREKWRSLVHVWTGEGHLLQSLVSTTTNSHVVGRDWKTFCDHSRNKPYNKHTEGRTETWSETWCLVTFVAYLCRWADKWSIWVSLILGWFYIMQPFKVDTIEGVFTWKQDKLTGLNFIVCELQYFSKILYSKNTLLL